MKFLRKLNIKGPVYPICPSFKKNEDLDINETKDYIKYLERRGAKNFIITAGTSRINSLSDKELKILNEILCKNTSKKSIKIVSNHVYGNLKKNLEFIEHAKQIKANAIIIYISERYYGDDAIYEFFKVIDEYCGNLKFFIHCANLRNEVKGKGDFVSLSKSLFDRLLKLKNFSGIKEEFGDPRLRYEIISSYSNKIDIITAGPSMQGYISNYSFGLKAYLSSVGSFDPKIEENFFKEFIKKKNFQRSIKYIKRFEDYWESDLDEGWHITMKAALNILGLMKIYERKPMKPVNKGTYNKIKKNLKKIKLI